MKTKLITEAKTLDRAMSRMPCAAWELIALAHVSSGQLPSRAWQMSLSSTDHHVCLSPDDDELMLNVLRCHLTY